MFRLLVLVSAAALVSAQTTVIVTTLDGRLSLFFKGADRDGNGQMSYQEFSDAVYAMDTDKNGKVIYREYEAAIKDPILSRSVFDYLDSDSDGHLDDDDLKVTFHQYDINGDAGVSSTEFTTAFKAMVSLVTQGATTGKPIIG